MSSLAASSTSPPSPRLPHRDAPVDAAAWERLLAQHSTAATCAAVLEIALFHPFDTAAKRLMAHTGRVSAGASLRERTLHAHNVLFGVHAHASVWRKVAYLYPGSSYAVVYKILQRVYKFAGQPVVRDWLDRWWGSAAMAVPTAAIATTTTTTTTTRGGGGAAVSCNGGVCTLHTPPSPPAARRDRVMTDALAGCLIGAGEVVLLPFDRLKVLSQTNEHALRGGLVPLLRREGVRGMYAGTLVTVCRNVPGSFCLFGGAAFTRTYVLKVRDRRRATLLENLCASTVGAVLSITVTNPMDVVKTRVQRQTATTPSSSSSAASCQRMSALETATRMLREEGVRAYFKGLTPKLLATAPKLVFAYTMTEFIYNAANRRLRSRTHAVE